MQTVTIKRMTNNQCQLYWPSSGGTLDTTIGTTPTGIDYVEIDGERRAIRPLPKQWDGSETAITFVGGRIVG